MGSSVAGCAGSLRRLDRGTRHKERPDDANVIIVRHPASRLFATGAVGDPDHPDRPAAGQADAGHTPWAPARGVCRALRFRNGGIFGLNEDLIKDRLAASAAAVTATVYHGDAAAAEPVIAKSWDYMQRAHLHGGAIGTAAIGMIVMLLLIGATPRTIRVLSLALGAGALGYSLFWVWAGFIAPGLGSTAPRKSHSDGSRCLRPAP